MAQNNMAICIPHPAKYFTTHQHLRTIVSVSSISNTFLTQPYTVLHYSHTHHGGLRIAISCPRDTPNPTDYPHASISFQSTNNLPSASGTHPPGTNPPSAPRFIHTTTHLSYTDSTHAADSVSPSTSSSVSPANSPTKSPTKTTDPTPPPYKPHIHRADPTSRSIFTTRPIPAPTLRCTLPPARMSRLRPRTLLRQGIQHVSLAGVSMVGSEGEDGKCGCEDGE